MKVLNVSFIFFLSLVFFVSSSAEVLGEESQVTFSVPYDSSIGKEDAEAHGTVLKGAEISSRGSNDISSIASTIPGLTFAGGTSRPRFLQIRGVGERELFEGIPTASVGFFYDGIDLTGVGGAASLFDVDTLEVVKGPNNFRGSSAIGGALFLESEDPTDFEAGKILFGFGSDDKKEYGVASGGKAHEGLLYRISAYRLQQDGFRKNTFLNRDTTNNKDTTTMTFSSRYKSANGVTFEPHFLATKIDDGYDAFTINNDYQTESDAPGVDEQRTIGASLVTTIPFDKNVVTSTAGFARSGMRQSFDGDWGNPLFWSPYTPYDYFFDQRRRPMNFYHDLRFKNKQLDLNTQYDASVEMGVFAQRSEESSDVDEFASQSAYRSYDSRFHVDSVSPYVKTSFVALPQVSLTFGGRVDNKHYTFNDSLEQNISQRNSLFGGLAELRAYRTKDDYTYLLVSTGERQGGVNPSQLVPEDRKRYDSERLIMYEAGDVGEFFSGAVIAKTGIFYGIKSNAQVKSSFQADPNNPVTFTYYTDNAAEGNLYGIENDTTYHLNEKISCRVIAQLLGTNIYDYNTLDRTINGRAQSYAPKWSYDFSTQYDVGRGLYLQGSVSGKGPLYFDDSFDARSRSYHLVGLSYGYRFQNFQVEVYGSNIFDRRYETRGFFFGNEPPEFEPKKYVQLGERAQYGIRGMYVW